MNFKGIELDVIITPEGEGESKVYSINSIQIPNVVTQGKTIEEAKKRLREAITLYLEDMPNERAILVKQIKEENNAPLITRIFL